jgi:mono/diheme cytochrome c family protein
MLKSLLITGVVAFATVSFGFANETQKIVIPVQRTAPNDGRQMYSNYCAPCHGMDGKGGGPAAFALKTQPTDLTKLTRNNRGRFPEAHVISALEFGPEVPAHVSATMPAWGPILGNMNRTNFQDKQLRISNLTRYLESMQER